MDVHLLGVNEAGHESANATATAGRDIPWLQDTATMSAWAAWSVTYRDVIILDKRQELFAVYNLTSNNLGLQERRDELKQLLRDAAAIP